MKPINYKQLAPGARLGTRAGILAQGRPFGQAGGHFGARARVWARGRAFWRPSAYLGTRVGILAPGRAFGHAGGHFGAWAPIWAYGWERLFCARAGKVPETQINVF